MIAPVLLLWGSVTCTVLSAAFIAEWLIQRRMERFLLGMDF